MTRYTPDYLMADGYYEVQGCGRDQTFKFKHDKLGALARWNTVDDTFLWLWNEPADTFCVKSVHEIRCLCGRFYGAQSLREDGIFDGSKPYSTIAVSTLDGWEPCRTP